MMSAVETTINTPVVEERHQVVLIGEARVAVRLAGEEATTTVRHVAARHIRLIVATEVVLVELRLELLRSKSEQK